MKVLIAVHHFPPRFNGGVEWRAHRMAKELQRKGHQVRVLCVDSIIYSVGQTLDYSDTYYDGIPVRRINLNLAQAIDTFRWSYRNPLISQYLTAILEEFEPDVMHLLSGYLMSGTAVEVARKAELPIIVTLTDFWFLCPRITLLRSDDSVCISPADPLACTLCLRKEKRRYRLLDRLTKGWAGRILSDFWQKNNDDLLKALRERKDYLLSILNTVDVVISPSQFLKKIFDAQGVKLRCFLYMRQGLGMSSWVDAKPSNIISHFRIGYIGQIAKHKGVDVLIKAFYRLRTGGKSVQLKIYGDSKQFSNFVNHLRKKVKKREDIVFAGRFENTNIRQIHSEIDVLVVPSIGYENSPNVILEAFANGTPVVVPRLGGMVELVTDGENGFHFEQRNAKSLARVLQRFIDQPNLVANLGQGVPPVKTVQEEIQELLHIYTSVREKYIPKFKHASIFSQPKNQ